MPYIPKSQMVMSTTYNLASSFTKQAVIGLDVQCIVLNEEDWEVFKSYFKVFELFFKGERCDLNQTHLNQITIKQVIRIIRFFYEKQLLSYSVNLKMVLHIVFMIC